MNKIFSPTGLLQSEKDAMQYPTAYKYDSQNRLIVTTMPGGASTSTNYDPLGHVTASTDLVQRKSTFQHDEIGRVTNTTTPGIDPVTSTYTHLKGSATTTVVTTGAGRTMTLSTETLDADGRTVTSVSPSVLLPETAAGQTTDITTGTFYTPEGWVDYTTNGKNKQTKFGYDNAGRVILVTTPGNGTINTEYHTAGWIKSRTNADKQKTTYGYDADGRTYTVTNNAGGSVTTNYVQGLVMSVVPSSGNGVSYTYDNDNTQKTMTDIFGKITVTTIDITNKTITKVTDNNPLRTTTTHLDPRAISYQIDTPLGAVNMTNRNDGFTLGTTVPGYGTATKIPDAMDRVVQRITPTGSSSQNFNPHNADMTNSTSVLGLINTPKWEPATGELISAADNVLAAQAGGRAVQARSLTIPLPIPPVAMPPDGGSKLPPLIQSISGNLVTIVERDKNGNILRYKDAMDRIWTNTYDDDDRPATTVAPDGILTEYAYFNPGGSEIQTLTVANEVTTFNYDPLGNLNFVQTPADIQQTATYDEFSRITSSTEDGLTTGYVYDQNTKQMTDVNAPGGRNTHTTYDDFGRVHFMRDPNGISTMYDYNDLDQLITKTYPDNSTEVFTYYQLGADLNSVGRVEWHTDRGLRKDHNHYGPGGRLSYKDLMEPDPNNAGQYLTTGTVNFEYNAAGQVTTETFAQGATTTSATHDYDARGRLKTVNGPAGYCAYTYNNDDTPLSKKYLSETLNYYYGSTGNDTGRLRAILGTTGATWMRYNAQGRVQMETTASATTQLVARSYTYNGELMQTMEQTVGGAVEDYAYTYDSSRIKTLNGPNGNISYSYDAAGRLYDESKDGVNSYHNTYSYDNNDNRVTQTGDKSLVFNYNNLNQLTDITGDEYTHYDYDSLGRNSMRMKYNTNETTLYTYDRLDRLKNVSTAISGGGINSGYTYAGASWMRTSAIINGTTTNYTYDGFACVSQTTNGTQTIYGVPGSSPMWETTNRITNSYAQDGQGSVSGLVGAGGYTNKFSYDAFGNINATGTNTPGPRYRGEFYDSSTDQYYLRNRYYQPGSSRFISADPIGYGGGMNMYSYCGGDPVNRSDPMGTDYIERDGNTVNWVVTTMHGRLGRIIRKVPIGEITGDALNFSEGFGGGRIFGYTSGGALNDLIENSTNSLIRSNNPSISYTAIGRTLRAFTPAAHIAGASQYQNEMESIQAEQRLQENLPAAGAVEELPDPILRGLARLNYRVYNFLSLGGLYNQDRLQGRLDLEDPTLTLTDAKSQTRWNVVRAGAGAFLTFEGGEGAALEGEEVTVYRVQPKGESNIVTGGAFRRLREQGKSLVEANAVRKKLLSNALSTDPAVQAKALVNAQANGLKSPFISTTFSYTGARDALEQLRAAGVDAELVTIRGPRSGGVDFEQAFKALGGRTKRFKDAELEEFGIKDLYIPPKGESSSGFSITGRE